MKRKTKTKMHVTKDCIRIKEGRFMVASANANGDTALSCSLPNNRLAVILSDGMGKGPNAAAESHNVAKELRKLLKKGVQPSKAIKLVNKKLLNGNEIFATVDLTIIDKNTGVARLYKMGAASSFLLRGERVKKIEQAALPVGIISRVRASQIKMKLQAGDLLVIVSDGITEADRKDLETKWLEEYLIRSPKDIGPKKMAVEITNIAQSKYKNREKDDITVVIIQIK